MKWIKLPSGECVNLARVAACGVYNGNLWLLFDGGSDGTRLYSVESPEAAAIRSALDALTAPEAAVVDTWKCTCGCHAYPYKGGPPECKCCDWNTRHGERVEPTPPSPAGEREAFKTLLFAHSWNQLKRGERGDLYSTQDCNAEFDSILAAYDAALVFGIIRKLRHGGTVKPDDLDLAFFAAERLHQAKLEGDTEPAGPVVFGLRSDDEVASIRKLAVSRGWFEVPSGSYEKLRMIDSATGGHVIVYFGKRGLKAVANVGQPAAQQLLREWRKTGRPA